MSHILYDDTYSMMFMHLSIALMFSFMQEFLSPYFTVVLSWQSVHYVELLTWLYTMHMSYHCMHSKMHESHCESVATSFWIWLPIFCRWWLCWLHRWISSDGIVLIYVVCQILLSQCCFSDFSTGQAFAGESYEKWHCVVLCFLRRAVHFFSTCSSQIPRPTPDPSISKYSGSFSL